MDNWTCDAGEWFDPAVIPDAEAVAYGTWFANRYPPSTYPNILWAGGGDFQAQPERMHVMMKVLEGIRAAGDTRPYTMQYHNHSQSTDVGAGTMPPTIGYNFVYTYQPSYDQVLEAYNFPGSGMPIPAIMMEQEYENDTNVFRVRRVNLWALTSGASGTYYGHGNVWGVPDLAFSYLTTTGVAQRQPIMSLFKSIPGWQNLVPEADSSTLVTAGRGTRYRFSTDGAEETASGTYVTAAKTPSGSTAVIYMPNASGSITVNTALITGASTAKWVDPANGAVVPTTFGTTYSRSTANSAGDPDWLLLLGDAPSGAVNGTFTGTRAEGSGAARTGTAVGTTVADGTFVGTRAEGSGSARTGVMDGTTVALGTFVGTRAEGSGAARTGVLFNGSVVFVGTRAEGSGRARTGLASGSTPGGTTLWYVKSGGVLVPAMLVGVRSGGVTVPATEVP
jgi:hypothetical protein